MAKVKQSFFSNIVGKEKYNVLRSMAKPIAMIGTCVLVVLFGLTFICHYTFVSKLFSLFTGTSLLFVVYIAALVLISDIQVNVYEPEPRSYYGEALNNTPKTKQYKWTIVWGVLLVLLGFAAIYFSNQYRKQYAFECSTVLVDEQKGIYHLDYDNDCEVANEAQHLIKMKGYELKGKNYKLCDWCADWAADAELDYESNRYFRK